jgi:RecA/RadA recombinase
VLGPEVLQVAMNNKRKREEQEQAVIQRQNDANNKRREAYEAAWAAVSHLPTSSWSVQQL